MKTYNKVTIDDIELSKHKRVVLRLDLNVPLKKGEIVDNNRIVQTIPTIKKLLESGLQVVILSHLSRIKTLLDVTTGFLSLKPVSDEIQRLLPDQKVLFLPSTDFDTVRNEIELLKDVNVFVLQNTRYYDVDLKNGEMVKWESKNNPLLAKFWATLGDLYVDDAFGVAHRENASNVGLAYILPSAIGCLMKSEIEHLTKAVDSKDHPKVVILGGSKVSDKLKLIKEIAPKVDKILVGGGMSYTFLKAQGKETGRSIVEVDMIEECKSMLSKYGEKIVLPIDHMVTVEYADVPGREVSADDRDWTDEMALDIGPNTAGLFSSILDTAQVVFWNGPMGVFEFEHYSSGTKAIALKLVDITKKMGAYTVVGGGDSAAAVDKYGLASQMSFVSTGGGASLAFLEGSKMPGLDSIPDR